MGPETGFDGRVFAGLLIVHCQVAVDARGGKQLGRRMVGAFAAEIRGLRPADARRVPDPPVLIQHGVVGIRLAVPDPFLAPVGRRHADGIAVGGGGLRIQHLRPECRVGVGHRIQDRKVVGAQFRRAEYLSIRVDRGIPPIRSRKIVQVGLGIRPVPHGRDHVAFDALRAFGYPGGRFAGGDAVGPVRQVLEGHAGEAGRKRFDHLPCGLSGLDAADPALFGGLDVHELLGEGPRG